MSERPGPGDALPDMALTTPDGGTVRPSDFAGRKLVLFFYPKDDTPGCTTENKDFSLAGEFDAAGVALLGEQGPAQEAREVHREARPAAPLASDAEEGGLSDGDLDRKVDVRPHLHGHGAHDLSGRRGRRIARVWNKVKVKGHAEEVLAAAKAL
jgi:peroxiredoxin Q/BCP